MTGDDLFAQQTCPRCGGTFAMAQTFCPHCGYAKEESWWEKLRRIFGSSSSVETAPTRRGNMLSFLIGLAVSGFFVYEALKTDSIQSWLLALFSLIMAIRAWFSSPKPMYPSDERGAIGADHPSEDQERVASVQDQHFYCENCGTEVAADASACPKCGMKFG